jgi:hypothetical protein
MRQAFQRGQRVFDDVVPGRARKAHHKAGAAGVVVGMPPVRMPEAAWPSSHTLSNHSNV